MFFIGTRSCLNLTKGRLEQLAQEIWQASLWRKVFSAISSLSRKDVEKIWRRDATSQVVAGIVKKIILSEKPNLRYQTNEKFNPDEVKAKLADPTGNVLVDLMKKSTFKVKNSLDKAIYLNRRWLPCFYMASVTDDVLFTTELTYNFLSSIDGKQTLIDRKWTCDLNCFFLCWRRVGCLFFDSLSCPPFGHNILCSPHTL